MVGAGSLAIIAKRAPISETEPESLTAENESLRLLPKLCICRHCRPRITRRSANA
jgi:hypothetical protein